MRNSGTYPVPALACLSSLCPGRVILQCVACWCAANLPCKQEYRVLPEHLILAAMLTCSMRHRTCSWHGASSRLSTTTHLQDEGVVRQLLAWCRLMAAWLLRVASQDVAQGRPPPMPLPEPAPEEFRALPVSADHVLWGRCLNSRGSL